MLDYKQAVDQITKKIYKLQSIYPSIFGDYLSMNWVKERSPVHHKANTHSRIDSGKQLNTFTPVVYVNLKSLKFWLYQTPFYTVIAIQCICILQLAPYIGVFFDTGRVCLFPWGIQIAYPHSRNSQETVHEASFSLKQCDEVNPLSQQFFWLLCKKICKFFYTTSVAVAVTGRLLNLCMLPRVVNTCAILNRT